MLALIVGLVCLIVGLAVGYVVGWNYRGLNLPKSKRFVEMFLAKEAAHRDTVNRLLAGNDALIARIEELQREAPKGE
jgi:hypothetical protein